MKQGRGPEFIRFFKPILTLLGKAGGSSTPAELLDHAIELAGVSEAEQEAVNKNGLSRVENQVHWARQYLVWGGYLDSSKRGIWSLTEKGKAADIAGLNPIELFKQVFKERAQAKQGKEEATPSVDESSPDDAEVTDHRTHLLDLIKSLPPNGFERLCQRLLREFKFQHVTVTGRSGDGGIDGIGTLQLNPFLSFTVLFQCKRYQGTVTASHVRDFRGAMHGRSDKGIILTTGTFTVDAKKEARRDGAPPIELVDGDALVDMFEQLGVGLIPKQSFDVDEQFFDEYRQ